MLKITTVHIGYSEAPEHQQWLRRMHRTDEEGKVFEGEYAEEQASGYLLNLGGPELGYYKTDVTTTFENGAVITFAP